MAILDENGVINWATDIKVLSDATYEKKPLIFNDVTVPVSSFDINRSVSELTITLNSEVHASSYLIFNDEIFESKINSLNLSDGTYTFTIVNDSSNKKAFQLVPENIITDPIVYDSSTSTYSIVDWGITINSNSYSSAAGTIYFYMDYLNPIIVSIYSSYPCRATIPLTGVNIEMITEVIFDINDYLSGNFAPFYEPYNGGIYLFSREKPSSSIIIPTIICYT